MGVQFSIKSREGKDRYIDANMKNVISELSFDIKQYGKWKRNNSEEIIIITDYSTISTKHRCRSSCSHRRALLFYEEK